mgnify:CR=1 FL=1
MAKYTRLNIKQAITMKNEYKGNCHCGAVQFNIKADLSHCIKCNCSFCVRKASNLIKVDESEFEIFSNESEMGVYGSRDFSDHYFCKNCGIQCFTRFKSENGQGVVVNIGCLEGVDNYSLEPVIFDGATKL